ncbi:unnamed protein product [Caenorhabditis brenneri]
MNLLILSLLFVVVSSHVIYPGDVDESSYLKNHLNHFNLNCTKPCPPGQKCVNGSCEQELCKTDDDCDTWAFCEDGRCWSVCSGVSDKVCIPPMTCHKGKCGLIFRPSSLNHHQFKRRSFRSGCAAPCGPGTTCMMGHCVQDAG